MGSHSIIILKNVIFYSLGQSTAASGQDNALLDRKTTFQDLAFGSGFVHVVDFESAVFQPT